MLATASTSTGTNDVHYLLLEVSAGIIIALLLSLVKWGPRWADKKLDHAVETTVREVLAEVSPNGGDSQRAGDILLRAGTAIGEMQKQQKKVNREVLKAIARIQGELRTLNGLTVGQLADRTEGRRINADVPRANQTASERHYSDSLADNQKEPQ